MADTCVSHPSRVLLRFPLPTPTPPSMKRVFPVFVLLTLALCLCAGAALADTYWVRSDIEYPLSLRDEYTNEVLTTVPAGTPLS